MDARFYNSEKLDIERLATDLENAYRVQGYQVQQLGNNEQKLVQLKKGGDLEALVGLQAALTVTIQRTSGGILVMVGQQKWIDKAAVGVVGFAFPVLWPLTITAGLGALRCAPGIGAALVGVGALLFAVSNRDVASVGRLLQGAGGVFALVGAIYIATKYFPASQAATLIGATQMFGMAGGAVGQFAVGPLMSSGLPWNRFWTAMGIGGVLMAGLLLILLPKEQRLQRPDSWLKTATGAFYVVFKNPQSILCGLISGLLFVPTTIFDMTWGIRYLQEGHSLDYASAVMRSATVPFGWIIGCPLLGFLSDRIGRPCCCHPFRSNPPHL